jgi:hypothetical protein
MRQLLMNRVDEGDVGEVYKLPAWKVREIAYATRSKKKSKRPSSMILATDRQINVPPITKEQALAEHPLLFRDEDGPRITPAMSFERAYQMYRWRRAGLTFKEIGERYVTAKSPNGISPERVAQVLARHGFPKQYKPQWIKEPTPSQIID